MHHGRLAVGSKGLSVGMICLVLDALAAVVRDRDSRPREADRLHPLYDSSFRSVAGVRGGRAI